MFRICSSTLPPAPNQCSPLCANDGHAWTNTKASIATTSASTTHASAPSMSSARRSDHQCGVSS